MTLDAGTRQALDQRIPQAPLRSADCRGQPTTAPMIPRSRSMRRVRATDRRRRFRREVAVDDAADVVLAEDARLRWPCRQLLASEARPRTAAHRTARLARRLARSGASVPIRSARGRRRSAWRRAGAWTESVPFRPRAHCTTGSGNTPKTRSRTTDATMTARDMAPTTGQWRRHLRSRLHEHHHHHVQVVARGDRGREHEHDGEARLRRRRRRARPAARTTWRRSPCRRRPGSRAARA